MCFAGIYDSGIGGLTTLFQLKKVFSDWDFYYYADLKSNPLGTKSHGEIVKTVEKGVEILKRHSLIQVIACNTASTVVKPTDAYLLKPDLDGLKPDRTLVLCTPATERALKLNEQGYLTADTKCLASLVEKVADISFENNDILHFIALERPLKTLIEKATERNEIDNIYLGCSHYLYFKGLLEKYYPNLTISDGNERLINELKELNLPLKGSGKVVFDFSLGNQSEKYNWLIEQMENLSTF